MLKLETRNSIFTTAGFAAVSVTTAENIITTAVILVEPPFSLPVLPGGAAVARLASTILN